MSRYFGVYYCPTESKWHDPNSTLHSELAPLPIVINFRKIQPSEVVSVLFLVPFGRIGIAAQEDILCNGTGILIVWSPILWTKYRLISLNSYLYVNIHNCLPFMRRCNSEHITFSNYIEFVLQDLWKEFSTADTARQVIFVLVYYISFSVVLVLNSWFWMY